MAVLLPHMASLRHCQTNEFIKLLKEKKHPIKQGKFFNALHWENTVNKLRAHHRCGATTFSLAQLSKLNLWLDAKKIMDLGAGSEQLAIKITDVHPSIHVTIVDLPGCADKINQALTEQQKQRVSVLSGDYNDMKLPKQYDIVWASMSLYYAKNLSELINNIKKSLIQGGCFISCHEGLTHQRTQPEKHMVGRLLPSLTGNNVSFKQGDIVTAMLKAGFRQIVSRTIETNIGPIDLDIGYV